MSRKVAAIICALLLCIMFGSAVATSAQQVAIAPDPSAGIQFVATLCPTNGNPVPCSDSNSGLSWGSAKATLAGAFSAMPSTGGTVTVGATYSSTLTSTLTWPADTRLVFAGPAQITCTVGSATCLSLRLEGDAIDGFCSAINPGSGNQCTEITSGSGDTGPIIVAARTTTLNNTLNSIRISNLAINMNSSTADAVDTMACWQCEIETVWIRNADGNGFHVLDDLVGSSNNLQSQLVIFTNDDYNASGGTGVGFLLDAKNGGGISEILFNNIKCSTTTQQCFKEQVTGVRQVAQVNVNVLSAFVNGNVRVIEFASPSGATISGCASGTTGCTGESVFNEVDIENATTSPGTQTVPAVGCTVGGSPSGAACAGIIINGGGAFGYQTGTWPDGIDYANLGTAAFVSGIGAQNNAIGRAVTVAGKFCILEGSFCGNFIHSDSANRTYTLPDASGTLALSGTNGISAGTCQILGSGYCSHTFSTPYSVSPVCTITGGTSFYANPSEITVYGPNTSVVNWICYPSTN